MSSPPSPSIPQRQRKKVGEEESNQNEKRPTSALLSLPISTTTSLVVRKMQKVVASTPVPAAAAAQTTTTTATLVSMLIRLPISIRLFIMNYLGGTQQELVNLTLLSKGNNEDCKRPGIDWDITPVFYLSPFKQDGGNTMNFIRKLHQYQQDDDINRKIQRYRRLVVHKVNDFHMFSGEDIEVIRRNNIRMDEITSLDLSYPTPPTTVVYNSWPIAISYIVPNVLELDFSNMGAACSILNIYSKNCPRLEKITWNRIPVTGYMHLDGSHFRFATHLKAIIMDNSIFYPGTQQEIMRWSDVKNHPSIFLFDELCNNRNSKSVLERLSIKNGKYLHRGCLISISQNALIKFVRNAPPTLKWFRSDLTNVKIKMLHKERPDIEFVN